MTGLILVSVAALAAAPTLATHATEHFVLRAEVDDGRLRVTGELLETARERFYRVFEGAGFELEPPRDRLEWLRVRDRRRLSDHASRADGVEMSWTHAYYSVRTNRVVLYGEDREAVVHEAAHQLAFNSGLQTRGVMYSLWATEGIATWFEERGREVELRRAVREGRLLPIEDFLTLPAVPSGADRDACYAQSWAVFRMFLDERPAALRDYLARLASAPSGPRAGETMRSEIVAALGPIDRLAASWRRRLAEVAGIVGPATP